MHGQMKLKRKISLPTWTLQNTTIAVCTAWCIILKNFSIFPFVVSIYTFLTILRTSKSFSFVKSQPRISEVRFIYRPLHVGFTVGRVAVRLWIGLTWFSPHCTIPAVAGSIPDGVTGNFHWQNPSGLTMTLSLTQSLREMSTRNISWG